MGSIKRFDLARIIDEFKTFYFFETGTFWGDGVAYALQSPFRKILSVEIIPEIADTARLRFSSNETVEIIESSSEDALSKRIGQIECNCVFWLDAHFPGADAGLKSYDENMNDSLRLPLINEIGIIHRLRRNYRDVLIIDDLRIYEDGPFENGNVPADALPPGNRNIDFIFKTFGNTHVILRCYLDEGYILLFPKFRYYTSKFLKMLRFQFMKEDFHLKHNQAGITPSST